MWKRHEPHYVADTAIIIIIIIILLVADKHISNRFDDRW